ncbi:MAG: hypothetical protein ABI781_15420 [Burkholderiales bacterium]
MNISLKTAGKAAVCTLAIACASLAPVAQAQSRGGGGHFAHGGGHGGYHGGGHYAPRYGYRRGGSGWIWGGVGLGLGLGLASYYNGYPYYYGDPGYVVVDPPVVYDNPQPVYNQPVPARSSQPVIYPRNGQSAAKTDADASACSEWAGKQPNASGDQSVFQRGIAACMDARGYTVR